MLESHTEILNEQKKFYANLYRADKEVHFNLRNNTPRRLKEPDISILNRELSTAELKEAVFKMKKGKFPGPDRIPADFYQVFWEDIKDVLFDCYTYEKGHLHKTARQGVLNLIPKGSKDSRFLKKLTANHLVKC